MKIERVKDFPAGGGRQVCEYAVNIRKHMMDEMLPTAIFNGADTCCIKAPNKNTAERWRCIATHMSPTASNIERYGERVASFGEAGMSVSTTVRPVDPKRTDGEYNLFIRVYRAE